ncbi:MAG: hypothetical protein LC130_29155 [Bryobacterales bacterium]|nr:hypothetical protein [Bryobacterales bacterium]MEB2361681.1 Npt1/Npt2 family nucleotide transporter [Bryobacterales bacterium]
MRRIRAFWNSMFDVRQGELLRTIYMSLYLLCVLFAYYIVKPVSKALFVHRFDIDEFPWLYILIALFGGIFAYVYTKIAIRTSLAAAVNWATGAFIGSLVLLWWLLGLNKDWMLYVFNIYTSLFGIVLVSQGWLVAANVFHPREAKRLYGILGMGAVLGAAFGGSFTAMAVEWVGTNNLVLASAVMVLLAYVAYRLAISQSGVSLAGAKAAGDEEADFSVTEVTVAMRRYRHLQVIMGIIAITFIVDVMIEYQFNVMAKLTFTDKENLTAFFGSFYGIYLNLATFVFQLFLTAAVVRYFGVGGALQIMPVTLGIASIFTFSFPHLFSASAARLGESASRYTFNRTGMELLFLPLPTELKNRTKAFLDIFVDRLSRGVGGIILLVLVGPLALDTRYIALIVLGLCVVWVLLSLRAKNEYVATVRKRLEARRFDLENARITVTDAATLRLLEETLNSGNPRQVTYALSLLETVPNYKLDDTLAKLVDNPSPEVRSKVFELAQTTGFTGLLENALAEIRSARESHRPSAVATAVSYALAVSPDAPELAKRLLAHPNCAVTESTLRAVAPHSELAAGLISYEWLREAAVDPRPERRVLAAVGVAARGDHGIGVLHSLLEDRDKQVASAALKAAGSLQNRAYLEGIVRRLGNPLLRGDAITALAQFGNRIFGTLSDLLHDEAIPLVVRRQIPRVLQHIGGQRSVDILLHSIAQPDLTIRGAVLRNLHRLRETSPHLKFGEESITTQVLGEARHYFELNAALAPFKDQRNPRTAAGLLAATLEERLRYTIERLFHLLGLRYPPKEIYAAYRAYRNNGPGSRSEDFSNAIEFLDNILDRELRRILLPLLDAPDRLERHGQELFGLEHLDAERAIRELIRSGDPWLVSCAMATAAELGLRALIPEIREACRSASPEVVEVARSAVAVLA